MKYRFINDHRGQYRVMTMCRVLGASRSGFYEWLHNPKSRRVIENERLLGLIRDSYAASSGVYGSPRVFGDLREAGETCGKHRVARIMRGTFDPFRMRVPRISTSSMAVRRMCMTGDTQRTISETAPGINE